MTARYEVEVLLRPAVEIYAAIVSWAAAVLMWVLPDVLFLPEPVARGAAGLLVLIGAWDAKRALTVWRYRAGMRRTPVYRLPVNKVPVAADRLFLGRGFRWTQRHTQRFLDTHEARYARFIEVPDSRDRFRLLRHTLARLPLLDTLLASDSVFNPLRPPSTAGGNPAVHGVELNERDIFLPSRAREGNTLVLGTTGAGKTRWIELLVAQDIARRSRDVVIVIDPKGDGELLRRITIDARRAGREEDLIVFHLGFPDYSARYNAVGNFSRITEIATRTANQLPTSGNSAAFKEFAWRFVNVTARALNALGERPDYREIRQAIDDIEPLLIRYFEHYMSLHPAIDWRGRLHAIKKTRGGDSEASKPLPRNFDGRSEAGYRYYRLFADHRDDIDDPVLIDLAACIRYDKTYYDKLVSSVGPLLEKLTSGKAGALLAPDYTAINDARPILNWRSAIRQRAIVYVGLDALSDATVSSAVGQSMLADLTSVAGELYKHGAYAGTGNDADEPTPKIWLHADEVNEIIGDEFIPMVNKCRGAGMVVTAYTQAWHDIESRTGSRAKAEQITANFNNLFMMRVRNRATAELLCEQLPEVSVSSMMAVSGATDSDYMGETHFTSRNEDRISSVKTRMLDPSVLMQLPSGQAFTLMEGGRLYKLRIPLPVMGNAASALPLRLEEIINAMNGQIVGSDWAEEEPWWNEVSPAVADTGAAR